MKITEIDLYLIKMRLIRPFRTSFGETYDRQCILVRLKSNYDLEGWGEVVAGEGPWYSYETIYTAWHVLTNFMIPLIIEKEIRNPKELMEILTPIRGHNMAKAGIEMAFWDLYSRYLNRPLYEVLGGIRDKIKSGISLGIQRDIKSLISLIERALAQGYKRIKIKIKPNWDVSVLKTVRDYFPEIPLQVDANAAYSLKDIDIFKKLDKFSLLMIEQPLGYDDLVDHAELQRNIKTPICLDESITSISMAKAAIRLKSCKVINIKPGRVGGHLNSIIIHNICLDNNIPVWIGGMLETGIGRAHNVALATLPNVKYPNDISASDRYYEEDIVEPLFKVNKDGTMNVPRGKGIGVSILEDRIMKFLIKEKSFKK